MDMYVLQTTGYFLQIPQPQWYCKTVQLRMSTLNQRSKRTPYFRLSGVQEEEEVERVMSIERPECM